MLREVRNLGRGETTPDLILLLFFEKDVAVYLPAPHLAPMGAPRLRYDTFFRESLKWVQEIGYRGGIVD